jgi:Kinesin motor domain
MDRCTLKIFARAKGNLENSVIKISKDLHEISIPDPNDKNATLVFDYNSVFLETSQDEVFEITARPIIEHVLDGFDGLILAYGATGTGKTYTIFGPDSDKGLYFKSILTILEESNKISSQKDVEVSISVIELFGNNIRDLALYYKDPHAINTIISQQLDISEVNGRVFIPQACEIQIKTIEEAVGLIKQTNDLRISLEAKQGKYVSKAHTIVSIKVRQKYKTAAWDQYSESVLFLVKLPGSEKPKGRKGLEFSESLSISSSFHALSKCLSSINSVSSYFNDHKLTRILENSLKNNSCITIIATVNIEKHYNDETIRTLNFIEKCKAANFKSQKGEANNTDLTIKLLQDERAMLKEKQKKQETAQEEQLKKIVETLGIEFDIDTLLQATPGSKELQRLAIQKESVSKVDQLTKKNRDIEKKILENKKVIEKVKKMDFQTQEKYLRQVLEMKDELYRLKDSLEEAKAAHEYNIKSQVLTKTYELNDMFQNSQTLLQEKLTIMNKLPKSITSPIKLPNTEDVKKDAKDEVKKKYEYKIKEQETSNNLYIETTKKRFEMQLQQREKGLEDIFNEYEEVRKNKDRDIETIKKEIKGLFEVVKAQKTVINGIQSGVYNQNLGCIDFPESILPEFPTQKTFPK